MAITVAMALSAAAAQAGVEIYGKARVSVDYNNNDNCAGFEKSNMSLSSDASRLGLKGDEDLGNGLSAMWTVEQNVDFDAARPSTSPARRSWAWTAVSVRWWVAGSTPRPEFDGQIRRLPRYQGRL